MYDLTQLTLQDVTAIGAYLRKLNKDTDSLEQVSQLCVQYLYEHFIDPETDEPACALARLFKTCAYEDLPTALQRQADKAISQQDASLTSSVKCLTLLGTTGTREEWCDRTASQGHQAIPLASERAVSQIPMISQLIQSFGLDISSVLTPDPDLLMALERKTCNVFYIPEAAKSEYIPAQESFVVPYGIRSVVGFGGMLSSGDLFAVILFSKASIPPETACLLKTLPLNIKMAMVPFLNKDVCCTLQSV
ncbi:MAG: hypothetical protein ACFB16_20585 [Phormidesmis sp.]